MPDRLHVRRATRKDVDQIARLLADDHLGSSREAPDAAADDYLRAFEQIDSDPNRLLVVAELDGDVVGTLQLTFVRSLTYRGAERAQIEAVRIASALRGRGLGRDLVEWAVDRARERGCRFVQLTSHRSREDAVRFYQRLGFVDTHRGLRLELDVGGPGARSSGR